MGKIIIMYVTAKYAEQLRNQLPKHHSLYIECNKLIEGFNKGIQNSTDFENDYKFYSILNEEIKKT